LSKDDVELSKDDVDCPKGLTVVGDCPEGVLDFCMSSAVDFVLETH
jgi:hypothetical protein